LIRKWEAILFYANACAYENILLFYSLIMLDDVSLLEEERKKKHKRKMLDCETEKDRK